MNDATISLYVGATTPAFDATLTYVGNQLRADGAGVLNLDFVDHHIEGERHRAWVVIAQFPDGHIVTGASALSTTAKDTDAIIAASCVLLRTLGLDAAADHVAAMRDARGEPT